LSSQPKGAAFLFLPPRQKKEQGFDRLSLSGFLN
jgi:hypothetical protein